VPTEPARECPIEVRGARASLGSNVVLDGVSFVLERGAFVTLLGPNGSGKTTLVRAALGLVALSAGSARLFGTPVQSFSAWHRVGYVPQRTTAAAGVPATVFEVVASGRIARSRRPGGHRRADRAAVARALGSVGLEHLARAPIAELSGGQQQRVLIARALAGEPDVLVLDEPIANVDAEGQSEFSHVLGSLSASGLSVLLVAHAVGVMEGLVTRSVVLERGRVVYEGAPRAEDVAPPHAHQHASEPPPRWEETVGRRS
jgi:zinc transport system ATP-binding protein